MKKNIYFYVNYNNMVVLQEYIDVIKKAFEDNGYNTYYVKSLDGVEKASIVMFPLAIDAFKFYIKGYKRIILWQQGATSEESYLRNKSNIRRNILNWIDTFVMKKAKMVFYVSKELERYYEKKSRRSFSSKSYIMPCFNEKVSEDDIPEKDYSRKIFTYVGSLDLWQCFPETVEMYKKIELAFENTFFKVLTFQKDEAIKILKEKDVKNYSVECVPKDEVKEKLEEVTYGFVIRKDIIVNQVATPTKLSSYLAAGVLPIYSKCLRDFDTITKNLEISCAADDLDKVIEFINCNHEAHVMRQQIGNLFSSYYNAEKHKENISKLIAETIT